MSAPLILDLLVLFLDFGRRVGFEGEGLPFGGGLVRGADRGEQGQEGEGDGWFEGLGGDLVGVRWWVLRMGEREPGGGLLCRLCNHFLEVRWFRR